MTRKDATSLVEKLTDYYEEKKILSTNFDCPHFARCRQGMRLTPEDARTEKDALNTFTQAKSALVGKHYEHTTPRLLFVSLDPGSAIHITHSFASPRSRTPEALQHHPKFELEVLRKKRKTHWIHTNTMAYVIYSICGIRPYKITDTSDYFSHVNAFKCSVNKPGRSKASSWLFNNCRWYLRGEIDVLSPDVIITQGKEAMEGIELAFQISGKRGECQTINLSNGKRALWLPTHHPARKDNSFKMQMEKEWGYAGRPWVRFAQEVREFVSQR